MQQRETKFFYGPAFFILPAFLVFILFLILPLCGTIALSFFRWDGYSLADLKFIGSKNYEQLSQDSVFWRALWNTMIFVGTAVTAQCMLGLVIALLLEQDLPLGKFLRGSYFVPAVVSLVVTGIAFEIILSRDLGVLHSLLEPVGLGRFADSLSLMLTNPKKAMIVLIAIQIWYGFGWSMFIFVSGLKAINPELYEAGKIDGVTGWQNTIYITLPLLKGTASVAILLTSMRTMKVFALPYVMTRGGPNHATEVLSTWAYCEGLTYQHLGYGSAGLVALLFLGLLVGFTIFKLTQMGK